MEENIMDDWYDDLSGLQFGGKDYYTGLKLAVVKDGDRSSYFRYGNENWDILTGRELLDASLEGGYVYERVIQLLLAEGFIPHDGIPPDTRFVMTSDCRNRSVTCVDTKENIELDPCMMMPYEQLKGGGMGPTMQDVIEYSRFKDMDKLTDEEWDRYFQERMDARKWKPAYPVDLENPVTLTDEQRARGELLYQKAADFIDQQPEDDHRPPMLCISQSWDISLDFGGMRSHSDVVRSIVDIMCKEEDSETGYYLDFDYVMQCVPFIEKELKENAEWCMEEYGEVPDGSQLRIDSRMDLEMQFIQSAYDIIDSGSIQDMVVAVDTIERSAYPAPLNYETYGDIIRLFPVDDFLVSEESETSIDIDKIRETVSDL